MTGTPGLLRLILRRDRFVMPLWVLGLGLLPYTYVTGFDTLFATVQERSDYARLSAGNAGFVALYGPLHGDSIGELTVWRGGFVPILVGLAALLTVIRHTRADEETGRLELIRATMVGRFAPLAAALIATIAATALMGVVVAATLIGKGLPPGGSVALGVVFAVSGWVFAGIGAVAAQLSSSARTARSIAVLVLGAAYVLRMGGGHRGPRERATGVAGLAVADRLGAPGLPVRCRRLVAGTPGGGSDADHGGRLGVPPGPP